MEMDEGEGIFHNREARRVEGEEEGLEEGRSVGVGDGGG